MFFCTQKFSVVFLLVCIRFNCQSEWANHAALWYLIYFILHDYYLKLNILFVEDRLMHVLSNNRYQSPLLLIIRICHPCSYKYHLIITDTKTKQWLNQTVSSKWRGQTRMREGLHDWVPCISRRLCGISGLKTVNEESSPILKYVILNYTLYIWIWNMTSVLMICRCVQYVHSNTQY